MWGVSIAVWHAATLLQLQVGVTLNEGFGSWSIWQYATGHSPYDHTNWDGPFFNFEVHPPLYFWLVGKCMAFTGASAQEVVRCGRLLSVASTLVVAASIGWCLRKRGATWWHVLLGVQLFCGTFYTAVIGARLQPDMLGIALAVAGIALVVVRDSTGMVATGTCLCALAPFAKQQYISGLLAVWLCYALAREWRKLCVAIEAGLATLILTYGLFLWLQDGAAMNLFGMQGATTYMLITMASNIRPMILTVVPVFMAGVAMTRLLGGGIDRGTRLLMLYAACSLMVATLALPKEAAGFYYYAESIAPLSILCALAMSEWHNQGRKRWSWLAGILAVTVVLGTFQVQRPVKQCVAMARMAQRNDELLAMALTNDTRMLFSYSDFMVRTRRPVFAADVFSMRQYVETHPEGAKRLEKQMAVGFYDAIVLEKPLDEMPSWRWGTTMLDLVRRHYRLRGRVGSLYIYEPVARQ